jgi:hypothetical protein
MVYLLFRPSDKWKKLSQLISIFKENLKKRETPLDIFPKNSQPKILNITMAFFFKQEKTN